MTTFITLHDANEHSAPFRLNSAHIISYRHLDDDAQKTLVSVSGDRFFVTETPERIDTMLGVGPPNSLHEATGDLLVALKEMLRADFVDETDARPTAERRADARRKAQAAIARASSPAPQQGVVEALTSALASMMKAHPVSTNVAQTDAAIKAHAALRAAKGGEPSNG